MKNKHKKWIIIAMACLLALLVLSPTLRYHLSPKVTAGAVTSGFIRYETGIVSYKVLSDDAVWLKSPELFSEEIKVENGQGEWPRLVVKGEILLSLDDTALSEALIQAEDAYILSRQTLKSFDKSYEERKKDVIKELETAERALARGQNASEKRKTELEQSVQEKRDIYAEVVDEGIHMGTTRKNLERRNDLNRKRFEGLTELSENEGKILSPIDGYCFIQAALITGSPVPQDTVLFQVIPQNAEYMLLIQTSFEKDIALHEGDEIIFMHTSNPHEVLRAEIVQNEKHEALEMVVEPKWEGMEAILDLSKYRVGFNSTFYNALIPNAAIMNAGKVYYLGEIRKGDQIKYIVRETEVELDLGNALYTPVKRGVTQGMMVVTAWDRSIYDGLEVMLVDE